MRERESSFYNRKSTVLSQEHGLELAIPLRDDGITEKEGGTQHKYLKKINNGLLI